jgi:hypothetical protein
MLIPSTMIPPWMKNICLPVPSCFRVRYSTIKKQRSGPYWISHNTYNFFCFNSSLSTEGTAFFFFTFPTILSRKLILSTMAPSRKHDGTGKQIFFIHGGIIVSVVLRFPLHPMHDRLTHFRHWLVFLVACLECMYPW